MSTIARDESGVAFEELDVWRSRELFDRAARRELGVSAAEFLRAWDAGEHDAEAEHPEVSSVARCLFRLARGDRPLEAMQQGANAR